MADYFRNSVTLVQIENGITILYTIDIVLNFFTTYRDEFGDEINSCRRIAIRYLKGEFMIDFISNFPLA